MRRGMIPALPVLLALSAWAADPALPTPAADSHVVMRLGAGQADLEAGRFSQALDAFRAALAAEPGNLPAQRGISLALIQQGRAPESQQVLETLIEQYPADYALKNNAAWLYATATNRASRNPARAVELAREALLLAPQDHHVWSTLAEAHYVKGDFARAARAARQTMALAALRDAEEPEMMTYREQLERAVRAEQAFSLVD